MANLTDKWWKCVIIALFIAITATVFEVEWWLTEKIAPLFIILGIAWAIRAYTNARALARAAHREAMVQMIADGVRKGIN